MPAPLLFRLGQTTMGSHAKDAMFGMARKGTTRAEARSFMREHFKMGFSNETWRWTREATRRGTVGARVEKTFSFSETLKYSLVPRVPMIGKKSYTQFLGSFERINPFTGIREILPIRFNYNLEGVPTYEQLQRRIKKAIQDWHDSPPTPNEATIDDVVHLQMLRYETVSNR